METHIKSDYVYDGIYGGFRALFDLFKALIISLWESDYFKPVIITGAAFIALYILLRIIGLSRKQAGFITDLVDAINSLFGR